MTLVPIFDAQGVRGDSEKSRALYWPGVCQIGRSHKDSHACQDISFGS